MLKFNPGKAEWELVEEQDRLRTSVGPGLGITSIIESRGGEEMEALKGEIRGLEE